MKAIIEWLKSIQFAKAMCAVLTFCAIGLFVSGFFVPPLGIIDGSVLKAGGVMLGFAALWVIAHVAIEIDKSSKAKLSKDGIEIEIKEDN